MITRNGLLTLATAALVMSGCAAHAGSGGSTGAYADGGFGGAAAVDPAEARIQVTNNNWADMNVYLVRGGMRHRLGTVTSFQTRQFTIPSDLVSGAGGVRLLADPVGSSDVFVTSELAVMPGNRVDFQLENMLSLSTARVLH